MKTIIFILTILFCPNLFAATLTSNTVPYVCQGGVSPQLCNSNITTDSHGNFGAVPTGGIIEWYGSIASIPVGWTLCNGVSVERSDGAGLITSPDLRDRFIVGARQDNNGVAQTNVTGSLTQSGNGQIPQESIALGVNDGGGYYGVGIPADTSLYPDGQSVSIGSGTVNVAVYYALAYIMKT